jgi:hypothetical protein
MKKPWVSFGSVAAVAAGLFLTASEARALGPLSFYSITPCRIVDTRGPTGVTGGPALAAAATRNFPIRGFCGIPSTAKAAVFNFAAIQPGQNGNLVVTPYPMPNPIPSISVLSYNAGEFAIANGAIVPLGLSTFDISVYVNVAPGSTAPVHLVIDATGYFQ